MQYMDHSFSTHLPSTADSQLPPASLPAAEDVYGGIIVEHGALPSDPKTFRCHLQVSLKVWRPMHSPPLPPPPFLPSQQVDLYSSWWSPVMMSCPRRQNRRWTSSGTGNTVTQDTVAQYRGLHLVFLTIQVRVELGCDLPLICLCDNHCFGNLAGKVWRDMGVKGVWLRLDLNQSPLVPEAIAEGFKYHHAEPVRGDPVCGPCRNGIMFAPGRCAHLSGRRHTLHVCVHTYVAAGMSHGNSTIHRAALCSPPCSQALTVCSGDNSCACVPRNMSCSSTGSLATCLPHCLPMPHTRWG